MGLELRAISLTPVGRQPLFPALTLSVAGGAIVTVMGPSGAGKSTLLDAIAGHLSAAFRLQGEILLDGVDITRQPPEQRRVGILFQDAVLFPHLSVADNLAFGLHPGCRGRRARRAERAVPPSPLRWPVPVWLVSRIGIQPPSRADSVHGWHCSAPCWHNPGHCCWTRLSPAWTRLPGAVCGR